MFTSELPSNMNQKKKKINKEHFLKLFAVRVRNKVTRKMNKICSK